MSFEKVLNTWEGKERDSAAITEKAFKDKFLQYLDANPAPDKDSGDEDGDGRDQGRYQSRKRLLSKKCEDSLDLHGKTQEEALPALTAFFEDCHARGLEKILVIHGKGNHSQGEAVLGQMCREFIEQCPYAGQYGKEKGSQGGSGATWVLLRP